jgi:hypothetical protein
MDVYSTELGIRLSFGKTSEFRGGRGVEPPNPTPPRYATEEPCNLIGNTAFQIAKLFLILLFVLSFVLRNHVYAAKHSHNISVSYTQNITLLHVSAIKSPSTERRQFEGIYTINTKITRTILEIYKIHKLTGINKITWILWLVLY